MSNNFCHYWRWLLQALLSDNRHSSAINVCSISCWQMTKHSQPLFSTSNNKYRQFIRMLRAFSSLQIKADQILILSHDSLLNRKLKLTVAMKGAWSPNPPGYATGHNKHLDQFYSRLLEPGRSTFTNTHWSSRVQTILFIFYQVKSTLKLK